MDDLVRRWLDATRDARRVVTDPDARYYGARLDDQSLRPRGSARLGPTHLADWLSQ